MSTATAAATTKADFTHTFHSTLLREYDIRGIVGETLSEADAYALGRSFAAMVSEKKANPTVAVGYDGRLSSPMLEAALVRGLVDAGAQVKRIGLGPTPMLYFAAVHLQADGGIMVTGSHNPPTHNGFKMVAFGKSVYGAAIADLGARAKAGALPVAAGGGASEVPELEAQYVARLAQDFQGGSKKLRVAWDAGNGAAGRVVDALVKQIPGEHITLFTEIDGTFPNHHPDPTIPKNLETLIATVQERECDLGLAFDGDADRLGVVDRAGNIWWGDQLLALYAEELLAKQPGATVIADVKASQYLFNRVAELGGKPLMWKTGHSLIKAKMKETGAPLAGEMSGHLFFADGYYGYDDGIYAAIRLLALMAERNETLDVLHKQLPVNFVTPEIRIACSDEEKFAVVERIVARAKADGIAFSDVDGIRANSADGWWLLRASNTQAIVVARCEGSSEAALERLKSQLSGYLAEENLVLESSDNH
jgi:phosphomannomutase